MVRIIDGFAFLSQVACKVDLFEIPIFIEEEMISKNDMQMQNDKTPKWP